MLFHNLAQNGSVTFTNYYNSKLFQRDKEENGGIKETVHQKQNMDGIIMTFTDTDSAWDLSTHQSGDECVTFEIYIFPWG